MRVNDEASNSCTATTTTIGSSVNVSCVFSSTVLAVVVGSIQDCLLPLAGNIEWHAVVPDASSNATSVAFILWDAALQLLTRLSESCATENGKIAVELARADVLAAMLVELVALLRSMKKKDEGTNPRVCAIEMVAFLCDWVALMAWWGRHMTPSYFSTTDVAPSASLPLLLVTNKTIKVVCEERQRTLAIAADVLTRVLQRLCTEVSSLLESALSGFLFIQGDASTVANAGEALESTVKDVTEVLTARLPLTSLSPPSPSLLEQVKKHVLQLALQAVAERVFDNAQQFAVEASDDVPARPPKADTDGWEWGEEEEDVIDQGDGKTETVVARENSPQDRLCRSLDLLTTHFGEDIVGEDPIMSSLRRLCQ